MNMSAFGGCGSVRAGVKALRGLQAEYLVIGSTLDLAMSDVVGKTMAKMRPYS